MRCVLRLVLLACVSALLLAVPEAGAQSLFATQGLGYPIQPQDARARGLGGVALGLPGPQINWANPAAGVGLPAPGLIFAYQYDNFSADVGAGLTMDGRTARFPLILAAFPAGERVTLQAGFGSFLDQNWSIQQADTLILGRDTVPVVDWSQSIGGVTRLRLGAGARVVPALSVGLGLDLYTGGAERVQGRSFPGEPRPACCDGAWDYTGLGVTGGVRWSPTEDSGVGASLSYGGKLRAERRDSVSAEREYELPITLAAGGSGRIGANTLVALAGSWVGWSDLDGALGTNTRIADSWSANGGVEWDGLTVRDRPVPLRVGARTGTLPFERPEIGAEGRVRERAVSFGLGAVLAGGAASPDLSLEFGTRGGEDAGFDESFWRVGFSILVMGR